MQKAIEMTTRYRQNKNTVIKQAYAGKEILAAYEQFSTGDLLKIRQPLAGSARVKVDEHAQALGDKLYDGLYTPGATTSEQQPVTP